MATVAAKLQRVNVRPVEWDALLPRSDAGLEVKWQVWVRRKGAGYWLLRYAARLARFIVRVERRFGRVVPDAPTNPNGLEEGTTFHTEEEAKDLCRLYFEKYGEQVAVTYTPLVIGRIYPFEAVLGAGDRRFDPFRVFDFSATEAVREQARHVLASIDDVEKLTSNLTGIRQLTKPQL